MGHLKSDHTGGSKRPLCYRERGCLVVNASDSGSRGRGFEHHSSQTVVCPSARHIYSPKVLVIPRKRWLSPNMTEKLFTGTLRINQQTLFAMLFSKGSLFRPSTSNGRPIYFFDQDPAHFRFILNYMRNGAMAQEGTLPRERRYLSELLSEVRFYRLRGLKEAI